MVFIINIEEKISKALNAAMLVQVEVSAKHVHLTSEAVEILFGKGKSLTCKRELSQPDQFLSEERVSLIGPKGKKSNVAVLGPARPNTQVELSKSDCISMGINAPMRESGNVKGSGKITIEGPYGTLSIDEGVIIAKSHIHVPKDVASELGFINEEKVMVEMITDRPIILKDVVIRVSDKFRYRMHIDFDEANACNHSSFVLGRIIK